MSDGNTHHCLLFHLENNLECARFMWHVSLNVCTLYPFILLFVFTFSKNFHVQVLKTVQDNKEKP